MNITLYRTLADVYGTHGHINDEQGNFLCNTIERPWLDNAPMVSCIPDGTYPCEPHIKSNNGQDVWILDGVPNRTGVLIHTGNTDGDSEGCILVGLQANAEGVLESQLALQKLKSVLPSNFTLIISSTYI